MPEEAIQDFEKPKEILEIEKTFGINLKRQREYLKYFVLPENFTYSLNEIGEIISLKINDAKINHIDTFANIISL